MKAILLNISLFFVSVCVYADANDSLVVKNYSYDQINELGSLPELKYLKIVDYKDSILPQNIGDFNNLEYLEIISSEIISIPSSIKNLTKLKTLIIANGFCDISIPPEIGELKNLRELNIYNFHFDSIPNEFGNLINMEECMLCGNLTKLPQSISKWKNIKSFYLADNNFSTIPSPIFYLNKLEYLDLEGNDITKINDSIKMLSNLTDLNFESNIQIDHLPESICEMDNLKSINIANTKISSLPDCLNKMDLLESVKICKTLFNNPQKLETTYKNKIKWEWNCRHLIASIVNFADIYGNYTLNYSLKKDTIILDCSYFYNEPGVIDEEYTRDIIIKIINKDSLVINKIYSVSHPNFIIKTTFSSIWSWEEIDKNMIEGYVLILDLTKKKCVAYLNLDIIERNKKRKLIDKVLTFK